MLVNRLTALIAVMAFLLATASAVAKPNVAIILAGELGYGDLSIQGLRVDSEVL